MSTFQSPPAKPEPRQSCSGKGSVPENRRFFICLPSLRADIGPRNQPSPWPAALAHVLVEVVRAVISVAQVCAPLVAAGGRRFAVADVVEAILELLASNDRAVTPVALAKGDLAQRIVLIEPAGTVRIRDTGALIGRVVGVIETDRRIGGRDGGDLREPVQIVIALGGGEPGRPTLLEGDGADQRRIGQG